MELSQFEVQCLIEQKIREYSWTRCVQSIARNVSHSMSLQHGVCMCLSVYEYHDNSSYYSYSYQAMYYGPMYYIEEGELEYDTEYASGYC